jgi:multicomponent Na+:H+ antiporter subunit D
MNNLLPVPVLLPMLGAALTLILGRRPRLQRLVSILVLTGVVAVAATLALQANAHGPQTLWVGAWPRGFGIVLVADRLSGLMLTVAALVTLAVLLYSAGQEQEEVKKETPVSIFHPTFLLMCAGVSNAFLAGDLFNLFVGFEILLFASYVLLTMGGDQVTHPGGLHLRRGQPAQFQPVPDRAGQRVRSRRNREPGPDRTADPHAA